MKSARQTAYELLLKAEKGAYSNLALDGALRGSPLSDADRRLAARLFYGVLERKLTLDYIIDNYSKRPVRRLDTEVVAALRLGVYQIAYCGNIPDSAAVNESVEIIKASPKKSASGFVNGVLRNIIRSSAGYELPDDPVKRLSVEYSCNEDIVRLLLDSYPEEDAVSLLASSFETSDTVIRVNTAKISAAELAEKLSAAGADEVYQPDIAVLHGKCLIVSGLSSAGISEMPLFREGYFHVQDISSQLCCEALAPHGNDTVIDICAAPGGKTFTAAGIMNGTGRIFAGDIHKKRADIIAKGAKRLGFANITAFEGDARVYNDKLPAADCVLCDVPCSGLGVIRGKPEIKYKDISDIAGLPAIQSAILENASRYVKRGGTLVYSTCTLVPAENRGVTDGFLRRHSDFEGVPFFTDLGVPFGGYAAEIFPKHFGSDGFYICKMTRK